MLFIQKNDFNTKISFTSVDISSTFEAQLTLEDLQAKDRKFGPYDNLDEVLEDMKLAAQSNDFKLVGNVLRMKVVLNSRQKFLNFYLKEV